MQGVPSDYTTLSGNACGRQRCMGLRERLTDTVLVKLSAECCRGNDFPFHRDSILSQQHRSHTSQCVDSRFQLTYRAAAEEISKQRHLQLLELQNAAGQIAQLIKRHPLDQAKIIWVLCGDVADNHVS